MMTRVIVNGVIAAIFGLCVGLHQARNGVEFPVWYTAVYAVLFTIGLNLLERFTGIFE